MPQYPPQQQQQQTGSGLPQYQYQPIQYGAQYPQQQQPQHQQWPQGRQ
jgi:hypothetical protein